MKTTKRKIVAIALVALIPLSVFAGEHRDDDHNDKFFSTQNKTLMKKANYEFEGEIQAKPKKGFNGIWKISGLEVIVDDKTIISHDEGFMKVGDEVEILGIRENNKVRALIIEEE